MYRLIKESFESNILNSVIGKMNNSEKKLFIQDLKKISEKYDQELSSFDDDQVSIVESKDELGQDIENCMIFNLSDKKWYKETKNKKIDISEDVDDYYKIRQINDRDFQRLPDGTVVIADLRSGDQSDYYDYYVCVKYYCPNDEYSYAIQNKRSGSMARTLYRTIFRNSWVIKSSSDIGAGKIWLVNPKESLEFQTCYESMELGKLKLDTEIKDGEEEYLKARYLKEESFLGNERLLVFHSNKLKSTGLSSKVSQRGQYDKTTEEQKVSENIFRYTRLILDKNDDDEGFVKKYLLGREYKMFFICMEMYGYLNLEFENNKGCIVRFVHNHKEILKKIKSLKSDDVVGKRMDKILEINRLISDKIDKYDFNDKYDRKAYYYYAKLVRDTCSSIFDPISDRDFKKIYNSAKNICK